MVDGDGIDPRRIASTEGFYYPQWDPSGTLLVTENNGPNSSPTPCNSIFDIYGNVPSRQHRRRRFEDSSAVRRHAGGEPGRPAVDRLRWTARADRCGGSTASLAQYDENMNYIFLNVANNGVYSSNADGGWRLRVTYDKKYQIAATRLVARRQDDRLRIQSPTVAMRYSYQLPEHCPRACVTDPSLGDQEAKFFPGG